MSDDTTDRLADIEARASAATEGSWRYGGQGWVFAAALVPNDGRSRGFRDLLTSVAREDDGLFIAHARDDVPYLLDLVERQRLSLRKIREDQEKAWAEVERLRAVVAVPRHFQAPKQDSPEAQLIADVEFMQSMLARRKGAIQKRDAQIDRLAETVQRVEAEAEAYAAQADVLEPCGAVAQSIRAALNPTPTEEDRGGSIGPLTRAAMEWVAYGSHPPGCCDTPTSPDPDAYAEAEGYLRDSAVSIQYDEDEATEFVTLADATAALDRLADALAPTSPDGGAS